MSQSDHFPGKTAKTLGTGNGIQSGKSYRVWVRNCFRGSSRKPSMLFLCQSRVTRHVHFICCLETAGEVGGTYSGLVG